MRQAALPEGLLARGGRWKLEHRHTRNRTGVPSLTCRLIRVRNTYIDKIIDNCLESTTKFQAIRAADFLIVANHVNPLHTHPFAHGMYVLEGTLVTDDRSGPRYFVWFLKDL
jgi:hypothetical protein